MYRKILVPLDGSEESEKALPAAQALLAESGGGEILVLRVLDIPTSSSWTSHNVLAAHEAEKAAVQAYLEGIKAKLKHPRVELLIHNGPSPAQAISDVAGERGVDLIAMTCHGRSALHQFILGSQTEKTLRLARCSVLVVRDPQPTPIKP